jgi:hypothetical protein
METLIREVLTAQADRAPHRATVLAGLRWTRPRRSYRRFAMVAAGITVVLAMIGVPIGLHLTNGDVTAASQPVLLAQQPDIPLPYHVTWLPAGYVATMRGVDTKTLTQRWAPKSVDRLLFDGATGTPYIQLDYQRAGGPGSGNVDVNGASGSLTDNGIAVGGASPATAELRWQPRPGVLLMVSAVNVPNLTSVVLHVARSVVAGSTGVVPRPMTLGWLPSGSHVDAVIVHGTSPNAWGVTCVLDAHARESIVSWATTKEGAYQIPLDPPLRAVHASLDGGFLEVTSVDLDPGLLKRIADGAVVFPHADLAWLGG